jgi:hypothetical protein
VGTVADRDQKVRLHRGGSWVPGTRDRSGRGTGRVERVPIHGHTCGSSLAPDPDRPFLRMDDVGLGSLLAYPSSIAKSPNYGVTSSERIK